MALRDGLRRAVAGSRRGAAARYRVVRQVVTDEVGTVWQAEDTTLVRPVSIRSIVDAAASDAGFIARFQRDVRTVKGLSHPNLAVSFTTHVGQRGRWGTFAVMEPLVETLRQRISREGPLPALDAARIAADLADGLQTAHEAGMIHGRLSADAVGLTPDGGVKIFDFGLAGGGGHRWDPGSVRVSEGEVQVGMSAEGTASRASTRAGDVQSLGVVLVEMLTGETTIPEGGPGELRSALQHVDEQIVDACLHAFWPGPRSQPSAAELSLALSAEGPPPTGDAGAEIQRGFGLVLREYRSRAGLTQAKLARKGGLHASLVSQLERGIKAPSLVVLYALADALGASPGEMLEAVERRRRSVAGVGDRPQIRLA